MSGILNLFSSTNDLTKKNSITNSASDYTKTNINVFKPTPGLSQGDKFKKYQKKIRQNLDKTVKTSNSKSKEGFSSKNTNTDFSLTKETRNVLSETNIIPEERDITFLQEQYKITLDEYENLLAKLSGATSGYLNRVSPNNPYLGKNIKIGKEIMYVTQQGIAKWYPDFWAIYYTCGRNGCPPNGQFIDTNLQWSINYETPGATIPTTPSLVTGTPMIQGQSCGNEGKNVYVNNMLDPNLQITPFYHGCFQDSITSPAMDYIGNTPLTSSSGTYNIDQCKQAAIDNGYNLYALQNVDENTSLGYCAVSNYMTNAAMYGLSMIPTAMVPLWSSGTSGQSGNVAVLTDQGALAVYNSSGTSVFNTDYSKSQPSNYLGCYVDAPNRAMPLYNGGSQEYNNAQCQQIAQQNGAAFYGLQNSTSGTTAQCAISSNWQLTSQYGKAGNCTQIGDGSYSGGGWSNAVYNTSLPQSNYFLALQDDGNMVICRGTSPLDNQGYIWATGVKVQQANPDYAAAKGKYGQNYITQGSTLAAGDFIGSPSGNMALIMQDDGNLVLYSFRFETNCKKIKDSNMIGGGVGANPVYELNIAGTKSNMGKLAYIDQNAELHAYPDDNKQSINEYTSFMNMDSGGNDIPNAASANSTIEQCQAVCNDNTDCYGFVFDTRNGSNICYPKNSGVYPVGDKQLLSGVNLFIKNVQPEFVPIGVSNNTNNSDTITYQNYVNGGNIGNEYGLSNATRLQKQELTQLQNRLNLLGSQIKNQTNSFIKGDTMINNQGVRNMVGLGSYLNEIDNTNNKIKATTGGNLQNILNDSDIVVLQQNYNYLFWSILAAGTVLISMNIIKK
uniref:Uncharacterized protein n=1 Tax=viral metagenome TaxID=1070528 RepID=A0A6C0EV22_9ZZZZ